MTIKELLCINNNTGCMFVNEMQV